MKRSLLALCCLLFKCSVAQKCPIEIWVFPSASDCVTSFQNASAMGLLYADNTCRTTDVLSSNGASAEALLPGTYSFHCVDGADQQVEFTDSGCLWPDCSTSFSGVCAHYADNVAALYADGQSPARFDVYDPDSKYVPGNHTCTTLTSDQGQSLTFILFGNCSDPACIPNATSPKPPQPPSNVTNSTVEPLATSAPSSNKPRTKKPTKPKSTSRPLPTVPPRGNGTTMSPTTEATPMPTNTALPTLEPDNFPPATPATAEPSASPEESTGATDSTALIISATVAGTMIVASIVGVVFLCHSRRKWRQAFCLANGSSQFDLAGDKHISHKRSRETTTAQVTSAPYMVDELTVSEQHSMPPQCITITEYGVQSSLDGASDIPSSHSSWASDDSFFIERIVDTVNPYKRRFRVVVPPGEIGVTFDTSSGVPEIYSMEANSVLLGRVRIGDQLLCVDGIDISDASQSELVRLINLRSDETRSLTFCRPSKMDGGKEGGDSAAEIN